ncbi:MAG: CDP-diacylglycerol--serine O-phosphatidyltransferase [Gammaproteobacteria bacterium]|nr:CDP-diacylglycerol--serine O-phosphatidyltransferase [Gammaproteobacteria bacterium]
MTENNEAPPARPRGIYLLPNLFTTISLFSGFYAIIAAMKGEFELACITIFIASISDSLDGRVARMTHTQTAFGAQYDSLSDMVSFGVAPALLAYCWSLYQLGKLGWLAAFIFTAAVTLRLARFNTQLGQEDKRYFQGLPCPAGAGVVTSAIWIANDYLLTGMEMLIALMLLVLFISAMMVSNVRYRSFKDFDLKNKVPFVAILAVVLILVGLVYAPPQMLFLTLFAYAISGPIMTLWVLRQKRLQRRLIKYE